MGEVIAFKTIRDLKAQAEALAIKRYAEQVWHGRIQHPCHLNRIRAADFIPVEGVPASMMPAFAIEEGLLVNLDGMVACLECDGTGWIDFDDNWGWPCDDCDGEGLIRKEENSK